MPETKRIRASLYYSTEEELALAHQVQQLERSSDQMCLQLKATEVSIMASRKIDSDKLDTLIANEHRREGAANSAKWLPIIIHSVVGLTVIYAFLNK